MGNRLFYGFLWCTLVCAGQEEGAPNNFTLEASPYYGSIIRHNPDVTHLITGHPSGVILGLNRKRYGHKEWEQLYGYPDTGLTFVYQDMNNPVLGKNFSLYAHYNFYFLKRNLQLRIAQGLAYTTNPYDKNENFRNNAYGSSFMSSTFLMLNYYRENILDKLGVKAGISLIHYSNANVKAPNTSTNTLAFHAGLVYNLEQEGEQEYIRSEIAQITEPIRYNLVFRTGINESDVLNSGQFPFYILSFYADKRLGHRSALQLGTEIFFSNFLKELIRYQSISFPELGVDPETDFKRIGIFLGHELFISSLSIITQFGYYAYYPFEFEGRTYLRVGLKHYFGEKWFAGLTLKSHAAKAEAVELGVGIRL